MEKQKKRLATALALVVVLIAVVALWNPVAKAVGADDTSASFSGTALVKDLVSSEGKDVGPIVENSISDVGQVYDTREVPAWFEEEVVSLEGVEEVRANEQWSVVGITTEGDFESVAKVICEELKERGWTLVESGVNGGITGTKKGGRLTWLWLSCIETSGSVSVVFQLPVLQ